MTDEEHGLEGQQTQVAQGTVTPAPLQPGAAEIEYLGTIAKQLVNELTPILSIKGVTTNPDLLGKYTEAAVRNLVKRIVYPMHVCTGAVIDHPMPERLLQLDLIIWAPHPAPTIFEVDGFGLVPAAAPWESLRSNAATMVLASPHTSNRSIAKPKPDA
jgi:hypothetical protein